MSTSPVRLLLLLFLVLVWLGPGSAAAEAKPAGAGEEDIDLTTFPHAVPGKHSFIEVLADPNLLVAEARGYAKRKDLVHTYRTLTLVGQLHPGSAHDQDALRVASRIFRKLYLRTRYSEPESPWHHSEGPVLWDWLARIAADSEKFPQVLFESVLFGMPKGYGERFQAYAPTRAGLARHPVELVYENGVVDEVLPKGE